MSVPTAFVSRSFLHLLCHVLSFLWKIEKFISVTKEVFAKINLGRLSGSSISSLPVTQGQLTYFLIQELTEENLLLLQLSSLSDNICPCIHVYAVEVFTRHMLYPFVFLISDPQEVKDNKIKCIETLVSEFSILLRGLIYCNCSRLFCFLVDLFFPH